MSNTLAGTQLPTRIESLERLFSRLPRDPQIRKHKKLFQYSQADIDSTSPLGSNKLTALKNSHENLFDGFCLGVVHCTDFSCMVIN